MIVYVPIIKGKQADIKAVGSLTPALRGYVKPLVELPFMPQGDKAVSPEEHARKFCDLIRKRLPLGEAFVDFYGFTGNEKCDDGSNAIQAAYKMLKACGRYVTPTYGLERDDRLWPTLSDVAASFKQGFCFRLSRDDLALPDDTWTSILQRSSELGMRPSQIDILLDLRTVEVNELGALKEQVVAFLFENPRVHEYRSVIVSGSSARLDVSGISDEQQAAVFRAELHLWSDLWLDLPGSERWPRKFGHPDKWKLCFITAGHEPEKAARP